MPYLPSHPYDNIPALLKHCPNWVTWGIRDAPLKSPYNPASLLAGRPSPAKAGIKETWSSYHIAVECVARGLAQGIGYEFDGGDLYGVDLDHVKNADGQLTPEAQAIVGKLNTYTEVSPSGNGLHMFVLAPGAEITRHRKKDFFLEIYNEGRYFTVTGAVPRGVGIKPVEARTAELQSIHDKYLLPAPIYALPSASPAPAHTMYAASVSPVNDAEAAYFLQTGLSRDKVFAALWRGERQHKNESADDQAFMNKLAYWCNTDPDTMIRAFCSSPFYAQKDALHTRKCCRADYLMNTAQKAINTAYSTAKADYDKWQQNRKRERSLVR